jgi:hypothetical protein
MVQKKADDSSFRKSDSLRPNFAPLRIPIASQFRCCRFAVDNVKTPILPYSFEYSLTTFTSNPYDRSEAQRRPLNADHMVCAASLCRAMVNKTQSFAMSEKLNTCVQMT